MSDAGRTGLLGFWTMSEASGQTRIDGSGNSLDAADVGIGGALGFDSDSDFGDGCVQSTAIAEARALEVPFASLPATFPGNADCEAYTIYIRVKPPSRDNLAFKAWSRKASATSTSDGPINIFQGGSGRDDLLLRHKDASDTNHEVNVDDALSTASFNSVVMRWQGDTDDELSVFIDGVKDATTHTPATLKSTTDPFTLMCYGAEITRAVDGKMDEAGVWDRALSGTEIEELHSSGVSAFTLADPIVEFRDPLRRRPQITIRPIPTGRSESLLWNSSATTMITTANAELTSQVLNTRGAHRLGFFYTLSATAGGLTDLTWSIQSTWDDGQTMYTSIGRTGSSAEGSRVDSQVGSGNRYVWFDIVAPITRIRLSAAVGAGESINLRDSAVYLQAGEHPS